MSARRKYQLWIDGAPRPALAGERFDSTDPTSGEPYAEYALARPADAAVAVAAARAALSGPWAEASASERGRLLTRFADALLEAGPRIAELESKENGKLLAEMANQSRMAPEWLRYFGGLVDKIEGRVIPVSRAETFNYTRMEPLGVIGIIVPWNSPLLLALQSLAPVLAAGNTAVVKPSEVTPGSALELCEIAAEVGIPSGVLNVVTGFGDVGAALTEDPGIAKVVFTGGAATGRAVAAATAARGAGCVLELGGKSANIVLPDADLDAASVAVAGGIFAAGGQSCTAGSRALLAREVYDEVVERVVDRARRLVLGDPTDPATEMGPMATAAHLERVDDMVAAAIRRGATVLHGGRRATVEALPDGSFFEPTVLAGLAADDPIAVEEVFGPVLAVLPFDTEEEAVRLANSGRYGLAAAVWTRDVKRAHRLAARLEAGNVWINMYRAMTYNSPFGGFKESGNGFLNGLSAIDEFMRVKSVWVELSDTVRDPLVLTR